jgi:hypothetical protein
MGADFPHSGRTDGASRARRFLVARLLVLAALLVSAASQAVHGQATQGLRVVPLVRDDQVLVSVELRDGFTPEVRAAIQSGLKTTFTYTVDLRIDAPGWIDRTISTAVVTNSVEYDNLKRKYTVERRLDGRVEDALVLDEEAEVRQWMTSMRQLRLFPTSVLEGNREYYVRVNATARPGQSSILWPFGSGTSAMAKFTFIR